MPAVLRQYADLSRPGVLPSNAMKSRRFKWSMGSRKLAEPAF